MVLTFYAQSTPFTFSKISSFADLFHLLLAVDARICLQNKEAKELASPFHTLCICYKRAFQFYELLT